MSYNGSAPNRGLHDENEAVIRALRHGPLYPSEIARRLAIPLPALQQRLYRMRRTGRLVPEPNQTKKRATARWGLPEHFPNEKTPVNPHMATSRSALDWRNTTLNYDMDAHRRLAMIGR